MLVFRCGRAYGIVDYLFSLFATFEHYKMTTDQDIDLAIDKTHLRDDRQIIPHVLRQYPNVTAGKVREVNRTRPKDDYPHRKSDYYYPIFSTHAYAFQMDLLEQSADRDANVYPAY